MLDDRHHKTRPALCITAQACLPGHDSFSNGNGQVFVWKASQVGAPFCMEALSTFPFRDAGISARLPLAWASSLFAAALSLKASDN